MFLVSLRYPMKFGINEYFQKKIVEMLIVHRQNWVKASQLSISRCRDLKFYLELMKEIK